MATTNMNSLYDEIRAAVGDHGVYEDGSLITDTYLYQDNVIKNTMLLSLQEAGLGFDSTGGTISVELSTGSTDRLLVIYWTALWLLLPERETFTRVPEFSQRKSDAKRHCDFLISRIEANLNDGALAYATDDSWQRLYNLATRRYNQVLGIQEA